MHKTNTIITIKYAVSLGALTAYEMVLERCLLLEVVSDGRCDDRPTT